MELPPGSLALFLILVAWVLLLVLSVLIMFFPRKFSGKSTGDVRRKAMEHEHEHPHHHSV
ncbi:MAG: hypothetical protein ACJ76H_12910 [Bacteriovoracaceae bacterium]